MALQSDWAAKMRICCIGSFDRCRVICLTCEVACPPFSAGPATEICKVDVQSMDGPQDSLGFASLELDH
jgi:hypothetical protein